MDGATAFSPIAANEKVKKTPEFPAIKQAARCDRIDLIDSQLGRI